MGFRRPRPGPRRRPAAIRASAVSEVDGQTARKIARDLAKRLQGDVEFDDITRHLYATDAGLNQILPLGVVSPRNSEDVVRLVQYCADRGVPLVPRGTGSGLAGGAVGAGIQVDFTRYMNRVLEVAPDGSWARVQPGVVLATLNEELRPYGTFFAPDPSSENYCSLGGMIGTNSSGARTVAYGGTIDHLLAAEVVLADGSCYRAEPVVFPGHDSMGAAGMAPTAADFAAAMSKPALPFDLTTHAGKALAAIVPAIIAHRSTITAALPQVVKNCSGYRLEALLEEAPSGLVLHPERLFVGAEGTLGLVTEAVLNLVPLPRCRGVAMVYFPSVFACGEAVPPLLELRPSAAEIMDARFLALVRQHDSRVDAMLPPRTDTALLVEFEGPDEEAVAARFAELQRRLAGGPVLGLVRAASPQETARLWMVRKSAVALVLRRPGPRRALPFIEDVTVHPSEVASYVNFLQSLFDRCGVEAVMYGHIGDGNIHTRPLLDPKDPADLSSLQSIFDEVFAYVRDVRGTMSGEHGDGLLRTPYIKALYGEEVYALFRLVKRAFDPEGLLNPGKKVTDTERDSLLADLRYGPDYRTLPQTPLLHFPRQEYEREIEKCHGCGQCKSVVATTMCPTYKITRREHASPRAKANLLRAVITGSLDPRTTYGRRATKATTDYCILCGMCAVECPSHVNIPKLMLEAKARYRALHEGSLRERVLGHPETAYRVAQALAPLANPALRSRVLRWAGQAVLGLDRRRTLPPFARRTFAALLRTEDTPCWSEGRGREQGALSGPPPDEQPVVAYFYDLYANYNEPDLAWQSRRLLAAHGIRVLVPPQRAAGIPEMLYGYVREAREIVRYNLQNLLPLVRQGAVVLSAEPTVSFALKVHYPDYAPSAECSLLAEASHDLGEFLARYRADHPERCPVAQPLPDRRWRSYPARPGDRVDHQVLRVAYHQPCHLKAQEVGSPSRDLLAEIPGVEVVDLAAGCCGMAGTFGLRARTYEFSLQVGEPLFRRLREVQPDLVASECSTCRLQIAQATGLETVHPVTLLAEAYGS